jgi:hypothetical protein
MIVEREQEVINLEKIASYRGYSFAQEAKADHFEVTLQFDGNAAKGTNSSCGS